VSIGLIKISRDFGLQRALVNTVIAFGFYKSRELDSEGLSASYGRLCSREFSYMQKLNKIDGWCKVAKCSQV
jgi:hypothetical protein